MTDIRKRTPKKPKPPPPIDKARPTKERRKLTALELRTRGYSIKAIAEYLGVPPTTISADINKELKLQAEIRKEAGATLMEQELLRLDRIIVGLQSRSFGKDDPRTEDPDIEIEDPETGDKISGSAIELMLKVIDMRAKLLKLYTPETSTTRQPLPWTDDF